jgi:hypothetical protein
VLRVLQAWRALYPDTDRVLPEWDHRNITTVHRKDLLTAGVTRQALHRDTATERKLSAKDGGRATFVTLALRAGAPERWVTDRTGHASQSMMERYNRMAQESRDTVRAWLRPLDEALGEELGIEPLSEAFVAPWLQGLGAPERAPAVTPELAALGQQLGQLMALVKQNGQLGPHFADSRYRRTGSATPQNPDETATRHPSKHASRRLGPLDNVGVGQASDPSGPALALIQQAAARAVAEGNWALADQLRALLTPPAGVASLDDARAKRGKR